MTIPSLAELRKQLGAAEFACSGDPDRNPWNWDFRLSLPLAAALLAVAEAAAEAARWHIPHAGGPVLSCADIDRLRALEAALIASGWAQGGGE